MQLGFDSNIWKNKLKSPKKIRFEDMSLPVLSKERAKIGPSGCSGSHSINSQFLKFLEFEISSVRSLEMEKIRFVHSICSVVLRMAVHGIVMATNTLNDAAFLYLSKTLTPMNDYSVEVNLVVRHVSSRIKADLFFSSVKED